MTVRRVYRLLGQLLSVHLSWILRFPCSLSLCSRKHYLPSFISRPGRSLCRLVSWLGNENMCWLAVMFAFTSCLHSLSFHVSTEFGQCFSVALVNDVLGVSTCFIFEPSTSYRHIYLDLVCSCCLWLWALAMNSQAEHICWECMMHLTVGLSQLSGCTTVDWCNGGTWHWSGSWPFNIVGSPRDFDLKWWFYLHISIHYHSHQYLQSYTYNYHTYAHIANTLTYLRFH